jgi:hypothetical protein
MAQTMDIVIFDVGNVLIRAETRIDALNIELDRGLPFPDSIAALADRLGASRGRGVGRWWNCDKLHGRWRMVSSSHEPAQNEMLTKCACRRYS